MSKLAYFINSSENNSYPNSLMTKEAGQSAMFSNSNYMMYNSNVGPKICKPKVCNINTLNKDLGIKKSQCFNKTDKGCYTRINDGRLKDAARGILLELDTPPYEGSIGNLHNVYSPKLNDINTGYINNYQGMTAGQIRYYTDSELTGAYPGRTGNYILRSNEDYYIYKNPMGVVELHTERHPLTEDRPNYLCGLNSMKDSISHREDIMGKQSYNFNKNSFQARYGQQFNN